MDVCKGKATEGSIGVGLGSGVVHRHIYKHTLPQKTLQQIAEGDTLLEFQSATTSLLETNNTRVRRDTGSRRGVLVRQEEETLHRNVGRVLG